MLNQVYMQTVWEERNRGPSELTAGRGLIGLGVGATSNVRSSGRIGFIFFTVRLLGTMREEVTESKHAIEIFRKKKRFSHVLEKEKNTMRPDTWAGDIDSISRYDPAHDGHLPLRYSPPPPQTASSSTYSTSSNNQHQHIVVLVSSPSPICNL